MRQQIRDMRYDEDNIPLIKELKNIYKFIKQLITLFNLALLLFKAIFLKLANSSLLHIISSSFS